MDIVVEREPTVDGRTFGRLLIDGVFYCHTLEDAVREIPGVPVAQWKVPDNTAIPEGRYETIVNYSARFKKRLPLLIGVKGFTGIRIHSGNRTADSSGCILVGLGRTSTQLVDSRLAMVGLMKRLQGLSRDDRIWTTVMSRKEHTDDADQPENVA